MRQWFDKVSDQLTAAVGSPGATAFAFVLIVVWAAGGPFLNFSEVWQLTINTATTIVTFLMVFVIQASQNRNDARLHKKLDELIHSLPQANNAVADDA